MGDDECYVTWMSAPPLSTFSPDFVGTGMRKLPPPGRGLGHEV